MSTDRGWLRGAAIAVAATTALGVGSAARMLILYRERGADISLGEALSSGVLDWYLWLPFLPVVVLAALRAPITRPRVVARAAVHLVLSMAVSAGQLSALALVSAWIRGDALPAHLRSAFLVKFHAGVFVYWAVALGVQAWSASRRAREEAVRRAELGEQLASARLASLYSHLRPHFLFNTLNSIAALARKAPDQAEEMIARLGTLLRRTLDDEGAHEIPLAEEVEFVTAYLAIEKARFGERLDVRIDVSPDAGDALVPPLLLQPLVENAVHHGIAPRVEGGHLSVDACIEAGRLKVAVADDGVWRDGDPADAPPGMGLASTRARLRLFYGDAARCDVRTNGAGTEVVVALPLRKERDDVPTRSWTSER